MPLYLCIAENLQMLQRIITELPKCIGLTDGVGNSPLHSIVKMPRPPETEAFVQVVETLLRIGGLSDILKTMPENWLWILLTPTQSLKHLIF